jgi:hypothetical protein
MERQKQIKVQTSILLIFLLFVTNIILIIDMLIKNPIVIDNELKIETNDSCKDILLNLGNPNSYINKVTKPYLIELMRNATRRF